MNISLVPPRKTVNNSTKQVACCVDDNMLITHTTLGITVSNTTQKSYKDVDPPPHWEENSGPLKSPERFP